MVYTCQYQSPMGDILLAADEIGLTGLWFVGQKYFANILPDEHIVRETPILAEAKRWLDVYFSGEEPNFTPPLHPILCIQTGSVADFAADPVWSDNDIRRDCRTTGRKTWHGSYVCTGSWRCSRA